MKFKYFKDYYENNSDDSPLYLFQSGLTQDTAVASLLDDFRTPDFLPSNFMSLVGEDKKPPYRWFCIGPERSGKQIVLRNFNRRIITENDFQVKLKWN
jgi:histone arginine demethylase JMJD6